MRDRLTTIAFLLPAGRAKNGLLRLLGHDVHPSAVVSPALAVGVGRFVLGADSFVGAGTLFRGLREVRLDRGARLGSLNWVSVAPEFLAEGPHTGRLVLGPGAAITARHTLDCSGTITLGEFSVVSGCRSVLLTHGIDDVDNLQRCAPITIGARARLGSGNQVVMGSVLPERSITAIGAVLRPGLTRTGRLYAGVPAVDKKAVDGAWFTRATAFTPTRLSAPPTPAGAHRASAPALDGAR